jgi:hypothetical protein
MTSPGASGSTAPVVTGAASVVSRGTPLTVPFAPVAPAVASSASCCLSAIGARPLSGFAITFDSPLAAASVAGMAESASELTAANAPGTGPAQGISPVDVSKRAKAARERQNAAPCLPDRAAASPSSSCRPIPLVPITTHATPAVYCQGTSPNAPTLPVVPPIRPWPLHPSLRGHGYCVTIRYATLHGADGLRVPQCGETVLANMMRRICKSCIHGSWRSSER